MLVEVHDPLFNILIKMMTPMHEVLYLISLWILRRFFHKKRPLYSYETSKQPLHSVFLLKHPYTDGEGLKRSLLSFLLSNFLYLIDLPFIFSEKMKKKNLPCPVYPHLLGNFRIFD